MAKDQDRLSRRAQDMLTTELGRRMAEKTSASGSGKSVYREFKDSLSAKDRAKVEAAEDRHAARQRRAGHSGW